MSRSTRKMADGTSVLLQNSLIVNERSKNVAADQITLKTTAKVPKIDKAKFAQIAEESKKTCPISKALTGPKIVLDAKLEN
jgi:osmotically inducible protein OsmC